MSFTQPSPTNFSVHTFGRQHLQPLQMGEVQGELQMGQTAVSAQQHGAAELPPDFDQLVRNIGEW